MAATLDVLSVSDPKKILRKFAAVMAKTIKKIMRNFAAVMVISTTNQVGKILLLGLYGIVYFQLVEFSLSNCSI